MSVNTFPAPATLEPGTNQLVLSKKIAFNSGAIALTTAIPADSYIVTVKSDVNRAVLPSYNDFTSSDMFNPTYVTTTSSVSSLELRTTQPFTQIGTSTDLTASIAGTSKLYYLNGYYFTIRAGQNGVYYKKESELLSFTSPDLDTWTLLTTGLPNNDLTSLAVNETNNTILATTGGSGASNFGLITVASGSVTSTLLTSPVTNTVDAAFGNGVFMIVTSGNACYTSPTGTTWTLRSSAVAGATTPLKLIYGGSTIGWLVANSNSTTAVYRSTTASGGVTWALVQTAASGTEYNDLVLSGDKVILNTRAQSADVAVYTTDGTTYTSITAKPAVVGDFNTVNTYVFFTNVITGETFRVSSDFLTFTSIQTFTPQTSAGSAFSRALCSSAGTLVYISYYSTNTDSTTTVAKLIENDCLVQFYKPILTE